MSYFLFPPLKLTTIFGTAILSQETTNFSVSSYQKRNGSGVKTKQEPTNPGAVLICLSNFLVLTEIVASETEIGGKMQSLQYACGHLFYCHYHYQKLHVFNP